MFKRNLIISALALVVGAQVVFGVPAKRGVVKSYEQADGSVVAVTLRGDERSHCYLTTDGYPLIEDGNGNLCYATVGDDGRAVSTGIKASDLRVRSAAEKAMLRTVDRDLTTAGLLKMRAEASPIITRGEKALRAARKVNQSTGIGLYDDIFPHAGTVHSLVVIVEYQDVKFKVEDPADFFTRMLNEKGFSDYGATGSARDYFTDASLNQFRPTFDVYGPVVLPEKCAYYGENDLYGNDAAPEYMVKHACELLDDKINFADYDLDNDGKVDNIFVIYAGQGEASEGASYTVWPHQWDLSKGGITLKLDGKIIDHYACTNEWEDKRPDGIGTFVHEFSHVMGLPDLYSTDYGPAASKTPGEWSVLDYGPYNNDGRTPPTYSIFERNAMGWIDPIVLDGEAHVELGHIMTTNNGAIKLTDSKSEFFLFENRQQAGWDEFIPGHGMLVWHIDYKANVWASAGVNDAASHQYVDIEEANGKANNDNWTTMQGYAFPGTSKNTSFTDDTTPSMLTWNGTRLNTPITNIKEEDGIISFDVCGGVYDLTAPIVTVADVTPDGFTLAWEKVDGATQYEINVFADAQLANCVVKTTSSNNSCKIKGLNPETAYYVTVYALRADKRSDPSQVVGVTTGEFDFAYLIPEAEEVVEKGNGYFVASWKPVEDAVDYLLTVTTAGEGEQVFTTDFGSGSTLKFPSGWETDIPASDKYTSKEYAGAAVPSVKFSRSGRYLQTPVFSRDIRRIEFWVRMALGSANDTSDSYLTVYGREDESAAWQTVALCKDVVAASGGETVVIDNIAEGICQLKFEYTKVTGNLAFDDLKIISGETEYIIFDDFDHKSVGGAMTSYTVYVDPSVNRSRAGEDALPTLGYTIQAVDSEGKKSAESKRVEVEMTTTGIASPEAAAEGDPVYYNMQGVRISAPTQPGFYIKQQGSRVDKVVK